MQKSIRHSELLDVDKGDQERKKSTCDKEVYKVKHGVGKKGTR